ncbi:paraneoplastic antigen Ma3 homolog [Antedon mediterranea]|uniref:paraneoplastic antigen Ma3 homolog n=1 Tax=Antedon mediterranea TaxID=105859 RepID=UPI003AF57867
MEVVYGSTLTGEELFHQFFSIEQKTGETPSHYLTRLQDSLRHVLQKGGISEDRMNAAILKQFIRGNIFEPLLLVDLRLRELQEAPPTYLTLLGKVRRWEEETSNRQMKAKGQSRNAVAASHSVQNNDLIERMSRIEKMLKQSTLGSTHTQQQSQQSQPESKPHQQKTQWQGRGRRQPSDFPKFCYNCGENGHIKRNCAKEVNAALVNEKLISHLHNQGNSNGHLKGGSQMSKKND